MDTACPSLVWATLVGPMTIDEPSEALLPVVENLDIETDTLHEILADRRRRYSLARLHEAVTPMHLGDLAEEIAAWERDHSQIDDPGTAGKIHQSLYHIHVAKMADAGLVNYDGMRDTVQLADEGHVLAAHLAPASEV